MFVIAKSSAMSFCIRAIASKHSFTSCFSLSEACFRLFFKSLSFITLSSSLVIPFLVVYVNILDRPGFRAVETYAADEYAALFKLLVGGGKEAADFLNAYLAFHNCLLSIIRSYRICCR